MNTVAALGVLLVAALVAADEGKFTTKYDNVNVDEVLHNQRLLENYLKCLLDEGKCTPDGQELKESIPEALKDKCAKCSEKQKEGTKKVIPFLVKEHPDYFLKLEKKYDPEGIWRKTYEPEAKKLGIELPPKQE
uniref:Chemosensory protein 3 n=1 Tax=Riptortus pedestris TaxID=329032 RepID=A0A2Z4HPZ2_RIPPE|nr:chemosensory protein 3 [Riptortus pedestris]